MKLPCKITKALTLPVVGALASTLLVTWPLSAEARKNTAFATKTTTNSSSSRDAASGQASGKRQYKPVR